MHHGNSDTTYPTSPIVTRLLATTHAQTQEMADLKIKDLQGTTKALQTDVANLQQEFLNTVQDLKHKQQEIDTNHHQFSVNQQNIQQAQTACDATLQQHINHPQDGQANLTA
jgi:hypothetical protein